MGFETRTKQIDGKEVTVTSLPARRALKLKFRLLKIFGPTLGTLLSSANTQSSDTPNVALSGSSLTDAFTQLAESIDPDIFVGLIEQMFDSIQIDGKKISMELFDVVFASKLSVVYQIIWFFLELNYSSFFAKISIGNVLSEFQSSPTPNAPKSSA